LQYIKYSQQFVFVMFDVQETSNFVTSLICHAAVLLITLINCANKDKTGSYTWTLISSSKYCYTFFL